MIHVKPATTCRTKRWAIALLFVTVVTFAQTPVQPAIHVYRQRGRIKSISPTQIVIEAVDLPKPQVFNLNDLTQSPYLHLGELVQVTFVVAGDLRLVRNIAEIVASTVNLPRGKTSADRASSVNLPRSTAPSRSPSSAASVDLPHGTATAANPSSTDVNLPTGSAAPRTLAAAPISLAADESQLIHLRNPEIHQSGVRTPIHIAILDFEPATGADLTPELATSISDRLAGLFQNDALFTIVRDPAITAKDLPGLAAKGIDAILTGEIQEDFPSSGDAPAPGQRHRIKAAALPTITLVAHLTATRTGSLVGSVQGMGGGSPDRPADHTPPLDRTVREAIESLATAIDPEYPELLDSRTFATVATSEPSHLAVTFAGIPTVQLGNRLQVSNPTWFTRDPATGNVIAAPTEPIGTLIISNLEKSEASGSYQGTPPTPGQTIRLTR